MTADTLVRRSPLAAFCDRLAAASQSTLSLAESPALTQIALRGDPADASFVAGVGAILGAMPPQVPNTVAVAGARSVLWLGPDEWLVVAPEADAALFAALRQALAGRAASVVDVSAARAVLSLVGPGARGLLACGCSLDLHPRVFTRGRCAQTVLARATVLLEQTGEEPAYRLFVRSSFAAYLATWLVDAAVEPIDMAF